MEIPRALYALYSRRLERELRGAALPGHVGVIMDGNRRWARSFGGSAREGHAAGAEKIFELLDWCEEVGIGVVTLWMLSTDNLGRDRDEVSALIEIIVDAIERIGDSGRRVHLVGSAEALPEDSARRIREVAVRTAGADGLVVNVAVGYGGREEIVAAVRDLLRESHAAGESSEDLARRLTPATIGEHLYTKGQPDPDLIIRTSGEQRGSGFLMWQSAHSEYWFCDAYWPGFRKIDFLRALRDFSQRERRFGA
jgi:short-chain Z-isoprenyl diphosphate synthase